MAKGDKKRHYKKALLEALEKSLGVVTTACKIVGIHRSTFYEYLKEDEEFRQQVEELDNMVLDFAESQLHNQIKDGNTSATIFYLKTRGRKRGYYEKTQFDHTTDDEPIKININLANGDKL